MKLPPFVRNIVAQLLTVYFRYVLIGLNRHYFGRIFDLLQPQLRTVQQDGVGALKQVEIRWRSEKITPNGSKKCQKNIMK